MYYSKSYNRRKVEVLIIWMKKLYKELRNITDEEKEILQGSDNIDRRLYMELQSDIINANKLLEQGKIINNQTTYKVYTFSKAYSRLY